MHCTVAAACDRFSMYAAAPPNSCFPIDAVATVWRTAAGGPVPVIMAELVIGDIAKVLWTLEFQQTW